MNFRVKAGKVEVSRKWVPSVFLRTVLGGDGVLGDGVLGTAFVDNHLLPRWLVRGGVALCRSPSLVLPKSVEVMFKVPQSCRAEDVAASSAMMSLSASTSTNTLAASNSISPGALTTSMAAL